EEHEHEEHGHEHDHDEMVEVNALEAAAQSGHHVSAGPEEPAIDLSFAVEGDEPATSDDGHPTAEAELAPLSAEPTGLEADASALVRGPGRPASNAPGKPGGRNRRRDERGGKQGGGRTRGRPRHPISELLQKGQSVVVQITKDAIGDKGPTLTTYISIPGRYLVLMPSMSRTGVSRKIEDEKERRRLKRILESLEIPAGMGVIVRTAGTGCTKEDLKRDLDYLMLLWDSFGKRLQLGRGPSPLYEESDVAIRTIRDLFNDHTEAVIVDDEKVYNRVREFMQKLIPEMVDRVQLHQGPKPLFHQHNVEQDFERIFSRRIDLPSGGSIVFDQAEALVAIDVNSGKTRSDGFDFEDVALRTNLDAVKEIARQIRLRDLGGIIVCDFIDMMRSGSRKKVENSLRDAMASDRARSKLGRISQFGLLELTRQRLGPGLSKMLFHNCQRCRGSGRLRTVESRTGAILRRLGSALVLKGFTKVEVRTQPEVVEYMKRSYNQDLRDLMLKHEKEIELVSVSDQIDDSVLRYLRADGREVRPGGRRKR
ncbi:MAG: Rne/Rng family ribonuclease, partial [Planctomycetota bacterium]